MEVGDQVRFIPVENCGCVHCAINMSGYNTVFIVMAVRGQKLSLCQSGSTYREWLTDGQVTAPIDHVIQVANKRTSPITSGSKA
jgi:hypothetical protein